MLGFGAGSETDKDHCVAPGMACSGDVLPRKEALQALPGRRKLREKREGAQPAVSGQPSGSAPPMPASSGKVRFPLTSLFVLISYKE